MNPSASRPLLSAMDLLRPRKSFADYAAIAICPVLIMLLVGSFVFFLVEIGYGGTHSGKLGWTLFWFVLAMVLITRIAIEKGYDHAGIYAFGLAAATGLVVTQYVNNFFGAWCILGLIWWATNKLTWDCTLIDEEVDASGEGLLQAAKLEVPAKAPDNAPSADTEGSAPTENQGRGAPVKPRRPAWWKLVYQKSSSSSAKPHAPGLWVLYFSLAALPVFGLGQGLIPPADSAARERGLLFIVVYVAASLGLLLITSFLGLRRYLRQRNLVMPRAISSSWVSLGATLGVAIVVGCILLPRPDAIWSFSSIMDRFGDPEAKAPQKAAKNSPFSESSASTPRQGEPSRRSSDDNSRAQQGRGAGGDRPARNPAAANVPAPEKRQGGNEGPSGTTDLQGPGPTSQARPAVSAPPLNLFNWIKLGLYAAAISLGLFLLFKNRKHVLLMLWSLWKAWQALWSKLFRRDQRSPSVAPIPRRSTRPAFASYSNPFSSGAAAQMSAPDLVVYSFEALSVWAESYKCSRHPEQTPFEFACQLADELPEVGVEAQELARLYAQVAYARAVELPPCRGVLEMLWTKMTHANALV